MSSAWFVVNVGEAAWESKGEFGVRCRFESPDARFEHFGINLQVLAPGQPSGLYHAESTQEDFLVLAGECLLLVEEEERLLRPWDFFHSPPGTEHTFVGAGDEPCVLFMAGARKEDRSLVYPRSELARRHGAGVETETRSARDAYAPYPHWQPERPPNWDQLPWSSPSG
jgi:uncharacterized cupin superfamily protein